MTILLCTSHRPSPRARTFCNDLVAASNEFKYISRGKTSLLLLSANAHSSGADRMWVVSSRFGSPKLIECFDTSRFKPVKVSSILMDRVVLRRELENVQSGRNCSLRLAPPEDNHLKDLYNCLVASLGALPVPKGETTELRISCCDGSLAELTFARGGTAYSCGPKIRIRDFR